MKVRVKKLGKGGAKNRWAIVGTTFDIIKVRKNSRGDTGFEMNSPRCSPSTGTIFCLFFDCAHLGGSGSEWELVDTDQTQHNTDDAYDRAMGIL